MITIILLVAIVANFFIITIQAIYYLYDKFNNKKRFDHQVNIAINMVVEEVMDDIVVDNVKLDELINSLSNEVYKNIHKHSGFEVNADEVINETKIKLYKDVHDIIYNIFDSMIN